MQSRSYFPQRHTGEQFLLYLLMALCGTCWVSCTSQSTTPISETPLLQIPQGFPQPVFPADNAFTAERFALGKRLFYDPILSRDSSISCASCHQQALAFSDGLPIAKGIENRIGMRNAPTLVNVVYHPYYLSEGGVPSLEMQSQVPIEEHNEFDYNIVLVAERMKRDSSYVKQSRVAYSREPDAFVITRAIACFERALISGNSPYDQYALQGKTNALNAAELRGKDLFFSQRLACSSCHSGFNFTDYDFKNNGLYEVYQDPGRYRLTHKDSDSALFKTPSLRNIALTAPYMHDGSFPTVEAVIEHYNSGGKAHPHKSPLIKPLNLSNQEKQDLVAFLRALTDRSFLDNPNFR